MNMFRGLVTALHALVICLAGIGVASAQANSIVGFDVAQQGAKKGAKK